MKFTDITLFLLMNFGNLVSFIGRQDNMFFCVFILFIFHRNKQTFNHTILMIWEYWLACKHAVQSTGELFWTSIYWALNKLALFTHYGHSKTTAILEMAHLNAIFKINFFMYLLLYKGIFNINENNFCTHITFSVSTMVSGFHKTDHRYLNLCSTTTEIPAQGKRAISLGLNYVWHSNIIYF